MNELSLFSGAGGGIIASKFLLKWRTIGYVEWNEHCQKSLKQRILEGLIDTAPIFGDIETFINSGCAELYRGITDIISAGFPCQPFSVAGHQKAECDDRNKWPSTCEVIKTVQPGGVFLENVPNLIGTGYIGNVLKDLSAAGYNARWLHLGAAQTGSICNGARIWIFASKANSTMLEGVDISKHIKPDTKESCRRQHSRAVGSMLSQDDYTKLKRNHDEVACGMERLKAIGNGQDPILAATAFNKLSRET